MAAWPVESTPASSLTPPIRQAHHELADGLDRRTVTA